MSTSIEFFPSQYDISALQSDSTSNPGSNWGTQQQTSHMYSSGDPFADEPPLWEGLLLLMINPQRTWF